MQIRYDRFSPTKGMNMANATTKTVAAVEKSTAKAAKPAVKPVAKVAKPEGELFLRFYHSEDLRAKTGAVFALLEDGADHAKHGSAMADLVAELTEAGMDYYYLKALKLAKVGFVKEQSARLGMSAAVKLINSVSRKFIESMDRYQLAVVAEHLRDLAK